MDFIGGINLNNVEKSFVRDWEENRKKGKLKYVLTTAALIGIAPLAGTVLGSLLLYNPINSYSITRYLPTYILIYLGGFVGGVIKSIYKWNKNEEKYSKLIHNDQP